jgi:two-component system response regulator PilR (NtrC family)
MWDPWAQERASEDLRARLTWFLFGRVLIISCFLGTVALFYLRQGEESYAVPVNRLLLIIAGTYGFSMVSAILLRRVKRLAGFSHAQIAFDVLLITGVIYLTGGLTSPFTFLYALPIINGAGLLLAHGAVVSALLAAVAYNGLIVALTTGTLKIDSPFGPQRLDLQSGLHFLTNNLSFFLIAYLAGVLARRLHQMETLMLEGQAERERLVLLQETLGRTIGSGLLTTDTEGRVTTANQTAEQLTGIASTQLAGMDIGAVFPQLQLTPSARLRFLQATGSIEPAEFTHEANGRPAAHIRCVAAPLKDTYAHPIGALYVLQDITPLKEMESHAAAAADLETTFRTDLQAAAESTVAADGLYGTSSVIARIRTIIDRVALSDATVLITGESGTGKELVARAIHTHSPRRDRPFVAINCGAIPEGLIESELFGHVRGAFTGAVADRAGCFRIADSGTIFLDEIGDLPLHLQVKMLRVLQERVFRPVGGETNVAVNVRVVAATNRDLITELKAGRFREDLFYRLNVITVDLPPLRERREDIPLLIRHFLRDFSGQHQRHVARFSVGAGRLLLQYQYPGNIRELENIIEHAVALCEGDTATEEHLPAYLKEGSHPIVPGTRLPTPGNGANWAPLPPDITSETIDLDRNLEDYEKSVLLRALDQAGGVKKRAAELLGINYRSLRHRLQKYGLGDPNEAAAPD